MEEGFLWSSLKHIRGFEAQRTGAVGAEYLYLGRAEAHTVGACGAIEAREGGPQT